jgi:hypothetical protein
MDLVRLIGQMLEKRREDRPQSYREITDRLVSVLRSTGSDGEPPCETGTEDGEKRSPTPPRGQTAPTQLVAARSRPSSVPSRRILGVVLAGAALLGLLLWGALTRGPQVAPGPRADRSTPRPVPATAEIRITSVPWAVVVSVVDVASGTAVALPSPAETPLVLPVRPGRYRVTLAEAPPGQSRAEREVTAASGAPALVALTFRPVEEIVETIR